MAVVERSRYAEPRLGESLSPAARPLLAYLGAWDAFAAQGHLPMRASEAAWGSDAVAATHFIFGAGGHGWHLDRRRFDSGLAELVAEAGGTLLAGTVVDGEERTRDGEWLVSLRDRATGERSALRARHLVDATGRRAAVARRHGAALHAHDRLQGVARVYTFAEERPLDAATLVESAQDGWWHCAPLPHGRAIATHMTDADLLRGRRLRDRERWAAALGATRHIRARVEGATADEPVPGRPAVSQILEPVAGDGWVAAGEAAVGFDPLSSMGIGYALSSGAEAARAVHAKLADGDDRTLEAYAENVRRHFDEFRLRQAEYYAMERRWPDAPFWRRRHGGPVGSARPS